MFKLVKYEQGCRDRAQGRPRRCPLENALAKGGQVDFMPTTSVVPPPLATPKTIVVSSRSSPVSGAAATPLMEHVTEAVDDIVEVALVGPSALATKEPHLDVSNV